MSKQDGISLGNLLTLIALLVTIIVATLSIAGELSGLREQANTNCQQTKAQSNGLRLIITQMVEDAKERDFALRVITPITC